MLTRSTARPLLFLIFSILPFLAHSPNACAGSEAFSGTVARDGRAEPPTKWYSDLISPITEAPLQFIVGSALTSAIFIDSRDLSKDSQREMLSHRPLRGLTEVGNLAGQLLPNALYSLGVWQFGGDRGSRLAGTMLKATAYAAAMTTTLKYTIQEQRPDTSQKNSFPSGHTTTAFAFASVVAMNHPLPYGIAAYALATLTGIARMNENRHYLQDVLAGATIGISYGIGISKNDMLRSDGGKLKTSISAFPLIKGDSLGIALTLRR